MKRVECSDLKPCCECVVEMCDVISFRMRQRSAKKSEGDNGVFDGSEIVMNLFLQK